MTASVFGKGEPCLRSSSVRPRDRAGRAPGVTSQDVLEATGTTRWPTFSGDYSGQRHSPLTQITPDNVHRLARAVDVSDRHHSAPRLRGHAAGGRRRRVPDRPVQQRLGARRAHRPAVLALQRELPNDLTYGAISPVNRGFGHARRTPVHGDGRRARRGARRARPAPCSGTRRWPTTRSATRRPPRRSSSRTR